MIILNFAYQVFKSFLIEVLADFWCVKNLDSLCNIPL